MTGERYYKQPNGDYFAIKTPKGHAKMWQGRFAVIPHNTGSVTPCEIGAVLLVKCERVNARDIPADWLEAITFDKGARLPRAGGGLTTKEHAAGVGVSGGAY